MKLIVAVTFAATVGAALAAGWTELGAIKGGTTSHAIMNGSKRFSDTGDSRTSFQTATLRKVSKRDNIEVMQIQVSRTDCSSRQGTIHFSNMAGVLLFETDFAFGAGSAGSVMAEYLCAT